MNDDWTENNLTLLGFTFLLGFLVDLSVLLALDLVDSLVFLFLVEQDRLHLGELAIPRSDLFDTEFVQLQVLVLLVTHSFLLHFTLLQNLILTPNLYARTTSISFSSSVVGSNFEANELEDVLKLFGAASSKRRKSSFRFFKTIPPHRDTWPLLSSYAT